MKESNWERQLMLTSNLHTHVHRHTHAPQPTHMPHSPTHVSIHTPTRTHTCSHGYTHTHTVLSYFREKDWGWRDRSGVKGCYLLHIMYLSMICLSHSPALCTWTFSKLKISEESSSENEDVSLAFNFGGWYKQQSPYFNTKEIHCFPWKWSLSWGIQIQPEWQLGRGSIDCCIPLHRDHCFPPYQGASLLLCDSHLGDTARAASPQWPFLQFLTLKATYTWMYYLIWWKMHQSSRPSELIQVLKGLEIFLKLK